jgi:hypothetical protein
MRTWVVGIMIGVCVLTTSCRKGEEIPGTGTNTSAVKVKPPKGEGLLKPWDFTYDCVTNESLGKIEVSRCRDELELAGSDKRKGVK